MEKRSKRSDALIKAQKEYEKNIVRKTIKFNKHNENDVELLEYLKGFPNTSDFIKTLIKKDMKDEI